MEEETDRRRYIRRVLDERMLQEFAYTMNSLPDRRAENAAAINERMAYHKIHSIEVVPLDEIEDEDADSILQKDEQKAVAKKVFSKHSGHQRGDHSDQTEAIS